jgi:hypothetical protein
VLVIRVTLAQYGAADSGIIITAAGDNTTNTAIKITTTNTGGKHAQLLITMVD